MKPSAIPAGLSGNQLTAYLEGYAAAAAWNDPDAAPFHAGSLRSDLCVSFLRGFNDGRIRRKDQSAGGQLVRTLSPRR